MSHSTEGAGVGATFKKFRKFGPFLHLDNVFLAFEKG